MVQTLSRPMLQTLFRPLPHYARTIFDHIISLGFLVASLYLHAYFHICLITSSWEPVKNRSCFTLFCESVLSEVFIVDLFGALWVELRGCMCWANVLSPSYLKQTRRWLALEAPVPRNLVPSYGFQRNCICTYTCRQNRHIKNLFKCPISLVVREGWKTTRSYPIPHLTGQLVSKRHLRVAEMVHQQE